MWVTGIITLVALYICIIVLGFVIACLKVGDVQPWFEMVRNVVCLLGQISVDGKSRFAKQRPKSLKSCQPAVPAYGVHAQTGGQPLRSGLHLNTVCTCRASAF